MRGPRLVTAVAIISPVGGIGDRMSPSGHDCMVPTDPTLPSGVANGVEQVRLVVRAMVRAGLAWAYLAYSRDYEAAEWEAQLLGNGVWAASVRAEPAWDWRRQKRARPANDNAAGSARIRG